MSLVRVLLAVAFAAGAMLLPALAQEQTAAQSCQDMAGPDMKLADIEPIGAIGVCLDAAKADPDNTDVRHWLARSYDAAEDYEKAHLHYGIAMDGGNLKSQAALGQLYEFGLGVDIDYARAAELYEAGVEAGIVNALEGMGKLYETGNGVEQDYARAAQLYRQASDAGSFWATASLGWLTENGWGVDKDDAEAVRLYQIAAAEGIDFAQNNLGTFYARGAGGLDKDPAEAVRYYTMAADQGMVLAYTNLAPHYSEGNGVKKDVATAESYWRKAIAEGDATQVAESANNLAWMFVTENIKLEEAEQLARDAVAANPEQPEFLDTLAWVLHQSGRSEDALPLIKKSVALGPTSEAAKAHLEAIEAAVAE